MGTTLTPNQELVRDYLALVTASNNFTLRLSRTPFGISPDYVRKFDDVHDTIVGLDEVVLGCDLANYDKRAAGLAVDQPSGPTPDDVQEIMDRKRSGIDNTADESARIKRRFTELDALITVDPKPDSLGRGYEWDMLSILFPIEHAEWWEEPPWLGPARLAEAAGNVEVVNFPEEDEELGGTVGKVSFTMTGLPITILAPDGEGIEIDIHGEAIFTINGQTDVVDGVPYGYTAHLLSFNGGDDSSRRVQATPDDIEKLSAEKLSRLIADAATPPRVLTAATGEAARRWFTKENG